MYFKLVTSGKRPSHAFKACYDRACSVHDNYVAIEALRHRANSNPSLSRQATHEEVRRISSSIPQQARSPVHSSPDWLTRTQQLLRSMRINNSSQSHAPLKRLSSRLTSHHSSSSEEWYTEMKKTSGIDSEVMRDSACNINKMDSLKSTDSDSHNASCISSNEDNIVLMLPRQTDNVSLSSHIELSSKQTVSKRERKSCPLCMLL